MARPFLSIIIPAYNEAKRLPLTLIDLDKHLSKEEFSYEILVIDDASSDNTPEIVRRFMSVVRNLRLLNNPEHRGKGAAVRIGMLSARGNWRLSMDADNSVSFSEFMNIMPHLLPDQNLAVISGSRYVRGARTGASLPLMRRLLERLLNFFIRSVFKMKIGDFLRGFKCFSALAAEKVFGKTRFNNWSYEQESLILAHKAGFQIKEIPVTANFRSGSHFRIMSYLQMFFETIKIWWWIKRNKYNF